MDTKDEEPGNQAWTRETCHAGNTRFFTNGAVARALSPSRLFMLVQKLQGPGPMVQFQEAAILPMSCRGSLVLIIYLVLMGYLKLKRRTQTTLVFHFIFYPIIPRLHPTKVAIDTHNLQPAWPMVLVMIPMELLSVVTEGCWKPEIGAVASAEVNTS